MANHRKRKKYSILEFGLALGNYDANSGGGYGKAVAGFRSKTRAISGDAGIYKEPYLDPDQDDDSEAPDDDIDITTKTGPSASRVDQGRRDPGGTSFDNVGYAANLAEVSYDAGYVNKDTIDPREDSNNPAMRNSITVGNGVTSAKTRSKGPSAGSGSSSNYIKQGVARKSGTKAGWSKAPDPQEGEVNTNTKFSLTNMLKEPEEYALLKHRKESEKIKNTLKEIFLYK
tara:strand:- start:12893 stop:13579 length:687 start_codon:yes stop_codon:yes gene_type:complete